MSETKTVLADLLTVISEKLGKESSLHLLWHEDSLAVGRFEVAGQNYSFSLMVKENPHE